MDVKLVKVIKTFGEFALINIEGKEFKAKVEGKIPGYEFLGEVSKKGDKVVIKVVDGASLSRSNDEVLMNLGLNPTKRNIFSLDVFKGLLLPIKVGIFKLLEVHGLPPLVLGLLVKARGDNVRKEDLTLVREVFNEYEKDNFSDDEVEAFLNSFLFGNVSNQRFFVFAVGDRDRKRWFGYVEYDGERFKKMILTTEIGDVGVYILLEALPSNYRLDVRFYGNVKIDSSSSDDLREKLEEIGISPIFVSVVVVGGDHEKGSSSKV